MNDLEKVVLGVLEDHEDTLILKNDFYKIDNIGMG